MYSLVLMAALTAPAEAQAWGHHSTGCTGCTGSYGTSCTGCGGCYGGSYGYGAFGFHRHGCCGGFTNWSCHGCGGCVGYGALNYYGFAGCYGSCYGSYTNYFSYWSVMPNVHYGYGMPIHVGSTAPRIPAVDPLKKNKTSITPAPATVVVRMPLNATLYANGVKTKQMSGERNFVTPNLEPGQVYHYNLVAETIRDGQTFQETRSVEVVAGGTTEVDFANLAAARAVTDPTRIASRDRIGE